MSIQGILGIKLGMTQFFAEDGTVVPVTVLKAGPCIVTQRKTRAKDGYEAAQLGLVAFVKPRRLNRPQLGHLKKVNLPPLRFLREVPVEPAGAGETKVGDKVLVENFQIDSYVDVTGVSKGRGFAGGVKRHHYRGGDASHGSMFHRAPGSIGASSFPSRVWKGLHMPGHMGNARVTARNLKVVKIDTEENLMLVRGAVPGANGGYVIIRKAKRPKR